MFFRKKPKTPENGHRSVAHRELKKWVGQPAPECLYDAGGGVLLEPGRVLTDCCFQLLCNQPVFAGPARPKPVAPPSPKPPRRWEERRHEDRNPEHRAVSVLFHIDAPENVDRRAGAALMDLSKSGMGVAYDGSVKPGTKLVAQIDPTPGAPIVEGVVRSCTPIAPPLHRLGIELNDKSPRAGAA